MRQAETERNKDRDRDRQRQRFVEPENIIVNQMSIDAAEKKCRIAFETTTTTQSSSEGL